MGYQVDGIEVTPSFASSLDAVRTVMPAPRACPALIASLLLLGLAGCPVSEPGTLLYPKEAGFAPSDARLFVVSSTGATVRDLDGTLQETIFEGPSSVMDISDDGRTIVLRDPDTNLYVGRRGRPIRRISELDGLATAAALSPDSRTVAVTRHYGWSLPRSRRGDEDTVFLVDVASGEVTVIPPATDAWPTGIAWEADGSAVWLWLLWIRGAVHERAVERVSIPDGKRTRIELPHRGALREKPIRPPGPECPHTGAEVRPRGFRGDLGLDLHYPDGRVRRLVTVEGRIRGGHDPYPTIDRPGFTPDCRHVVFLFHSTLHAVDVETGAIRVIGRARDWFLDPAG